MLCCISHVQTDTDSRTDIFFLKSSFGPSETYNYFENRESKFAQIPYSLVKIKEKIKNMQDKDKKHKLFNDLHINILHFLKYCRNKTTKKEYLLL